MDAVWFLLAFAALVGAVWGLGAHGLAVILGGCAVVTALVELVWILVFHRSASQETGRLPRWKLLAVITLIEAGAIGLGLHLWAMR